MLIQSTERSARPAAAVAYKSVQATTPAENLSNPSDQFTSTVSQTSDEWGVMGQKIGALALVAAGTSVIPFQALMAFPNMPVPLAIGLGIGTMAGLAIEERKLGLGKMVGNGVGRLMGAGFGAAKGALGFHPTNNTTPIELKRVDAGSVKNYEPLAPKLLHGAQSLVSGAPARRTQAVEMGELVGATAGVLVTSYYVPRLLMSLAGESSVIGAVAGSLVGPLAGMIVGGWQENTLGLGRAAGELVGSGLSALGVGNTLPKDVKIPEGKVVKSEPGALKSAFLAYNKAVAEPIVGPLVDATIASNVLFAETPVQTIEFKDRPLPTVNRERLIKNFISWASIYGPSGEEKLVGEALVHKAQELGAQTQTLDDGTVIATLKATAGFEDAPTVLLSAHQDTVEATNPEAIRVNDYKIYTDGKHILGADDRAGIAQIMEGLESVLEQGLSHPEIKLVFPVDEERGLRGAARLQPEDISTRPTLGYVVDALRVDDLHLTNDAVIVNPRSLKYSFSQADPVAQVALRSMAQAGTKPRVRHAPILTGAGSDANTPAFNSGLIRTLAVGVGESNMHTGMEQITKNELERAARHVVGYITNACDLKVEGTEIVARHD